MMEKTTFFLLLIVYFIIFSMKTNILNSLHKKDILKGLDQKVATYIFVFLFVVLMVVGVLFTKSDDFTNVSDGFEKVRNSSDKNRPHRYFDINTY